MMAVLEGTVAEVGLEVVAVANAPVNTVLV